MEFITSRGFKLPESKKGMSDEVWFNMWQRRERAYRELASGNILYWYESQTERVVWKTRVLDVDSFPYSHKDDALNRLEERFGEIDPSQPYYVDAPSSGYCLGFRVEALERLNIPKPSSRKFRRSGWLPGDDKLFHEWLSKSEIPLVLVENEATEGGHYDDWKDVTGERYHFPNQYRNKVVSGRPFVYYRGVRRRAGKSGTPEYFGVGRIGEVWKDLDMPADAPKSRQKWFCNIQDYEPFQEPVLAKIDGEYVEKIPSNHWGIGVRETPREIFERILQLAGMNAEELNPGVLDIPDMPGIDEVIPSAIPDGSSLLVQQSQKAGGGNGSGGRRLSRYSKAIGDRAEEIVVRFLEENLSSGESRSVRWVAQEGEKPGWDIEYRNKDELVIAVEVKGTGGSSFPNIELTAGEWKAAKELRERYALFLVANCRSREPSIQKIWDPVRLYESGHLNATPMTWRIELCSD